MIAELSQYALGLIFESNSPLYQEFEIDYKNKTTYYEDFMFLEYLFRPENLPSIFEYLSKNLYSKLEECDEVVPTSFASNIGDKELINILNNPDKLQKTNSDIKLASYLGGFLPIEVGEVDYNDSIDVAENRFFKYFLELVRDLIEKLLDNSKEGYIKDKLTFFNEEIVYYLSNKLFGDIGTLDYIPFNSQVLQKREGYRDIFQFFLMFEFSFKLSWDELNNQFKGFEKKLSELYEYWCYFKILKVLNEMSISKVDFEDVFEINKNNWSMDIKRGHKSIKKFKLNLFDQDIRLESENLIKTTGVEDFIAKAIIDNFISNTDTFINKDYLQVVIKTHTKKQTAVNNVQDGIYNLHTWMTNCTQNYDIVYSFSIVNKKLVITIENKSYKKELIDTQAQAISNYVEVFETDVVSKVEVLYDKVNGAEQKGIYTLYLLSDRTTTTNMNDVNRADGKVATVYTENYEDAQQKALDVMKANSYNHNITFNMYEKMMKIGTPIAIKTKESLIFDTYISAIKITQNKFIEYTCGNIRIKFIDKILKERKR